MRFEDWRLDSIWPVDLLARFLSGHRRAGHRIVLTNGCFDVLHRGHVECLQQAASLGDVLVVGVHSDESVRKLKGTGRPMMPAGDRAAIVAAIGCVEYVTVFDDDSVTDLVEALRRPGDQRRVPAGPVDRGPGRADPRLGRFGARRRPGPPPLTSRPGHHL